MAIAERRAFTGLRRHALGLLEKLQQLPVDVQEVDRRSPRRCGSNPIISSNLIQNLVWATSTTLLPFPVAGGLLVGLPAEGGASARKRVKAGTRVPTSGTSESFTGIGWLAGFREC